jgi:hypothetical protein
VRDLRRLANTVDRKSDPMRDPVRLDHRLAEAAIERKRHRDDGLERVALGTARRRHIGFLVRSAHSEVQDLGDRLGGDSRPVVGDRDVSTFHLDIDDGRAADLLGLIERVVGQLLEDDQGPLLGRVSGLRRQFLERAELNKPARREHVAFEAVRFGRSGVARQTSDGLTAGAVVLMVVLHLSSCSFASPAVWRHRRGASVSRFMHRAPRPLLCSASLERT